MGIEGICFYCDYTINEVFYHVDISITTYTIAFRTPLTRSMQGFDMRTSKIGSFGRGCYFADAPTTSSDDDPRDRGVAPDPGHPGLQHVLVCLVALGRCRSFGTGLTCTGLKAAPPGYDSVLGHVRNGNELVVYDDHRVLVSHVAYYRGGPPPLPVAPMVGFAGPGMPPPGVLTSLSGVGGGLMAGGAGGGGGGGGSGGSSGPPPLSGPNVQTTTVMIPAALKLFFTELVERATKSHPDCKVYCLGLLESLEYIALEYIALIQSNKLCSGIPLHCVGFGGKERRAWRGERDSQGIGCGGENFFFSLISLLSYPSSPSIFLVAINPPSICNCGRAVFFIRLLTHAYPSLSPPLSSFSLIPTSSPLLFSLVLPLFTQQVFFSLCAARYCMVADLAPDCLRVSI